MRYLRLGPGGGAAQGLTELLLEGAQLLLLLAAPTTELTLQEPGAHRSQHQTQNPEPPER